MNKKGFTLVELVVAIAILGVITLIAIPTVKSIQSNNTKSKYITYEKALTTSGKAYTDAYDEDLFGAANSGCAIVNYSDLKERDLIQDIQLKNTSCSKYTCIYVRKTKNGNYHYETHTTCIEKNEIVFGDGSTCNPDLCSIEDGKGPTAEIIVSPNKTKYYLDDDTKVKVKIKDIGVGLKEKQVLSYVWSGNKETSGNKTINFNNKNYAATASKYIDLPSTLKNLHEPATFTLKVYGTVYDVNGNESKIELTKEIYYFVGAVLIQMKSGKATMSSNNSNYKIDSEDYIINKANKTNEQRIISKIKYKETNDLYNYNNPDYINLVKSYYSIKATEEWKNDIGLFNQQTKYASSAFKIKDEDLFHENKTVTVTANWKPITYTIKYNLNGGTVSSSNPTSYNVETASFTLNNPTRTGYTFTGWTGTNGTTPQKSITIPKGSHGNRNYTANWKIIKYSIKYNYDGGKGSNPSSYDVETATFNLNNPTKSGYLFTGWTGTNGTTPQKTVTITKGSTGNRSYTANWKKIYTYTVNFYYQGYHAVFNQANQTRTCYVYEPGASCTVSAPGISNVPATSACGTPYSSLLVVQGWNTNPSAGTGVSGNISVNQNTNYYSIITPNYGYVNRYCFQVYGHTCNSKLTARNVLERYAPAEGAHPSNKNDITTIKEESSFLWTGAWAIYGAATNPDHDTNAWFYLHGIGTSCRYAYKKNKKGKHPSSTCQYAWIKAFQLRW
jgi:uncharacterized repeat protein (TIGR02543 family)/prepilin-type N-terminal cleavage/methylation domain-containing protein